MSGEVRCGIGVGGGRTCGGLLAIVTRDELGGGGRFEARCSRHGLMSIDKDEIQEALNRGSVAIARTLIVGKARCVRD